MSRRDCGHPSPPPRYPSPILHPLPTNCHHSLNTVTGPTQSGQETSNPRDIFGCYSEIFCSSTMTGDEEDATKVETALPHTRSRSCSATKKSHLKSRPSILSLTAKRIRTKSNQMSKKLRPLPPSHRDHPPKPRGSPSWKQPLLQPWTS